MRTTYFVVSLYFALSVPLLFSGTAGAQNPGGDCRIEVSTPIAPRPPLYTNAVQRSAGQAVRFELNEHGVRSELILRGGCSAKDALKWFERAAMRGFAPAQVNLAVMYENGWGTEVNYGAALNWLHTAAEQGFPEAYFNLGILYLEGKGLRQDYAEAFRWFQMGAKTGDSDAETDLGFMYEKGLGTDQSSTLAAVWYRKAADSGNPLAENNLADMYLHGDGVPQDDMASFRLFRKAAEQGHTSAGIMLAYMYAQGRGTRSDPGAALAWVIAESRAGDTRGQDLAASLKTNLSAEQIARAVQLAASLQPARTQDLGPR